ncbi:MAG: tRNA pseudouridine(55) synthase TruB [bacterium]|nr:tRNA pseudouridine(55) synthase TruB [bacterium]
MTGILLIDKPQGVTSHDVVDMVRRAAGMRRVGHTGTLDPAATGLLILCLGPATRLSEFLTGLDKEYEGTMRLGLVTDSYDLDGTVTEENPVPDGLSADEVQAQFDRFTGDIMQIPPMVSAVKVGGKRLYKLARKGEVVERPPRPVTVREFALLGFEPPDVQFRVTCTRGTYARALCHDVGRELGCGATLAALRRTRVGAHSVDGAVSPDALTSQNDVLAKLVPVEDALDIPEVVVTGKAVEAVGSGSMIAGPSLVRWPEDLKEGWVQIKAPTGELLALGEIQGGVTGAVIQPKRVLRAKL